MIIISLALLAALLFIVAAFVIGRHMMRMRIAEPLPVQYRTLAHIERDRDQEWLLARVNQWKEREGILRAEPDRLAFATPYKTEIEIKCSEDESGYLAEVDVNPFKKGTDANEVREVLGWYEQELAAFFGVSREKMRFTTVAEHQQKQAIWCDTAFDR